MLRITIPEFECYDERTGQFIVIPDTELELEHSLHSLALWESKWNKPFLGKEVKTVDQCLDYVRCMTISQNISPIVYRGVTSVLFDQINAYIEAPMTATWFNDKENKKPNREIITAEIIYYWMTALNIPFECQYWHLNRLLTLIRVCNIKNTPQKKMTKKEIMDRNRALNAQRKSRLKTHG